MKTNPAFKIFKLSTLVPLAIAIVSTLVTTPAFAQAPTPTPPNHLVFTEDSTGLSATYNGTALTVVDNGGTGGTQHWTVTMPASVTFSQAANFSWIEPENTALFNNVGLSTGQTQVSSDVTLAFPGTPLMDDTQTGVIPGGLDTSNFGPIVATFDDDGEPTVPDTGSTLGLLALALAGLFGASRIRSIRLA